MRNMSVVNDRTYWVGNGMQDGQEQAELDYKSGQGRNYTARSGSWQIGYAAWMERLQRSRGQKVIRDLVPATLNRYGPVDKTA
jgi:hypothetical protein